MVSFFEESTKNMAADAKSVLNNMSITVTLKPPAPHGYISISRKKLLQNLEIGSGGAAARVNAWVDSMRASSPTHMKSTPSSLTDNNDQTCWNLNHPSALDMFDNNDQTCWNLNHPSALDMFDNNDQTCWNLNHPSALDMLEQIIDASKGKQIVMFLDYDGTLSPIVADPDRAFMSKKMRKTVRKLAKCFPTAIVSGRCRDKVYKFVKLAELYYAGSHGMDIKGPEKRSKSNKDTESVLFQPASEFLPMIDEVYKQLVDTTKATPGAKVENNKFCVSVHFRCVEEKKWSELAQKVRSVLKEYPKLELSQGRKVFEIRPTIKWDKGKALEFLLESLGFANCTDVFPVYIGDDRTDEDAFKILRDRGQGCGILVSKFPKETDASYSLQEPDEVMDFLRRLVQWKQLTQSRM